MCQPEPLFTRLQSHRRGSRGAALAGRPRDDEEGRSVPDEVRQGSIETASAILNRVEP